MVYWTIQHKDVIDVLNKQGTYYPDFEKSPQVHRETYDRLLRIFNEFNKTEYKGLIFCIAKDGRTDKSLTFQNEADFSEYMKSRPLVLDALNNGAYTLLDDNHLLCRVETDKFDKQWLCIVDFWNYIMMDGTSQFQYEMCRPSNPSLENVSYEDFVELAWKMMRECKMFRPLMSNTIFQFNIPYIEQDMLKETYSLEPLVNA